MAFQTPITIKSALDRIQKHEYALPAIQREFVWSKDQICKLFDSLMRGYPIGSFLFWKVEPETRPNFVVYDFIREYHQYRNPHCPRLDLPSDHAFTAILDGQQRLTALNIGLRGSHAEKLPRKRRSNLDAYPKRELFLNLESAPDNEESDAAFNFRFLSSTDAAEASEVGGTHWFPVSRIYDIKAGPEIFHYIQGAGLADHATAFDTLDQLHRVVHEERIINFYEVEGQDLEHVLSIFIRVNSAGTTLSYSDILLSMATAQWKELDARAVIYGLVDDLRETGQGFAFSKDLVLKAGLVLADVSDIRFKVTNFDARNMGILEDNWDSISNALLLAGGILSDFGFSEANLRADSVLIPIAYYCKLRDFDSSFREAAVHEDDRREMRSWVLRSLMKAGVWGSALDSLLTLLRGQIREHGSDGFPTAEIESAMAPQGKSLKFDADVIDDLVETSYGNKGVFPILTLLYPGVNTRNEFHVDHIFPRKLMTPRRLKASGVSEEDLVGFGDAVNGLPNLQLLEGPQNIQKGAALPEPWARRTYPDEQARSMYLSSHDMHDLPEGTTDFLRFYEARRDRMAVRLRDLLAVK